MNIKSKKVVLTASMVLGLICSCAGGYSILKKDLTIVYGGEINQISTFKSNVEEVLEEQKMKIDSNDKLNVKLDDKLKDDMEVEVVLVTEEVIKEEESIPYQVKVVEDKNLDKGKTKVEQEGTEGKNELSYKITYHNGDQVNKEFISKKVSVEPIDRLVKKGTKEEIIVASRGATNRESSKSSSVNGKTMTVTATAYTGHGITATGTKPKWGTIAVDPRVIPYGTKVYIPKFNKVFTAEDCGGAIKGNKIDIYMNDSGSVYNWGRKAIEIQVMK